MKKVTMQNIADLCGVSKALVSRILNEDNTLRVTDETRQRVLHEAEKQKYIKNVAAQTLSSTKQNKTSSASTKKKSIGILYYEHNLGQAHPFWTLITENINSELTAKGYIVELSMSIHVFAENMKRLASIYREKNRLDGLIFYGLPENITNSRKDEQFLKTIKKIAKNIVCLDTITDFSMDMVCIDLMHAAELSIQHMVSLGYTDIGIVYGKKNFDRLNIYKSILQKYDLTFNPEWILDGGYTVSIAKNQILQSLTHNKPPRALIVWNDEMAIGCLKALISSGYRVPDDVAIIGQDDISIAPYVEIPLTSIRIDRIEYARLAVSTLIDKIENKRKSTIKTLFLPKLIRRESCGYKLVQDSEETDFD